MRVYLQDGCHKEMVPDSSGRKVDYQGVMRMFVHGSKQDLSGHGPDMGKEMGRQVCERVHKVRKTFHT